MEELKDNELKLYMYMTSKCFETGQCFFSQSTLGEILNLKQNTISTLMKGLSNKYFIQIHKQAITKYISYCTYTLLR